MRLENECRADRIRTQIRPHRRRTRPVTAMNRSHPDDSRGEVGALDGCVGHARKGGLGGFLALKRGLKYKPDVNISWPPGLRDE